MIGTQSEREVNREAFTKLQRQCIGVRLVCLLCVNNGDNDALAPLFKCFFFSLFNYSNN